MIIRYFSEKRTLFKEGSRRLLKAGLNSQVKKWLDSSWKNEEPALPQDNVKLSSK